MILPNDFTNRMKSSLGDAYPAYLSAMNETPKKSLRVNTLKTDIEAFAGIFPSGALSPNGIVREGFLVPQDYAPGRDPLHSAGLFYMQEASAQMPAKLLNAQPGEWILDLCAAPGGKSGQIAAMLNHTGLLVSNEIVPSRATVLRHTLERLGVRNAVITNAHPSALCSSLAGCFDAVLVDAPCSGEGMFRKEPEAVAAWSLEHVSACANRQREILKSAVTAVKPGGRLVYSTCTFSREENEDNAQWLLKTYPCFTLVTEQHLYPHTCTGEGQYAALFVRDDSPALRGAVEPQRPDRCDAATLFIRDNMTAAPEGILRVLKDGRVFMLPPVLPAGLDKHRILATGVELGEFINGRFSPAHALFLAYPQSMFLRFFEPSEKELAAFLAGEQIPSPRKDAGYIAVGVSGFSVGFGKLTNGQIKNHLPKGLRLR